MNVSTKQPTSDDHPKFYHYIFALKEQILPKKFCRKNKKTYLCSAKAKIGVWCNGNTTDSGPVIYGSSPYTPTQIRQIGVSARFF